MKLGKLMDFKINGSNIVLTFEERSAVLRIITPEIVNVFCKMEEAEKTQTLPPSSYAIEGEKALPGEFSAEKKEDGLWIATEALKVRICDGFYVDFFDPEGRCTCEDYRGKRVPLLRGVDEKRKALLEAEGHWLNQADEEHRVQVVKTMTAGEHFYGLGDKTGFLDKRGYDYEMWNTDDPIPLMFHFISLYKSVPFFLTIKDWTEEKGKAGSSVYGLFFDNTYKSWVNLGQESPDYFWFGADNGDLNYYYIAGASVPEVLKHYTYLTGRTPLPQKWTLGYHQCRWGYVTQEDVKNVACSMRNYDIPCDSIHLDIDYMQDYKIFTWNSSRYEGNPDAFLETLTENGFKTVCIIDPGIKSEAGYAIYEEGVEKGYFAKTPDGEVYHNWVWPGDSVYPDFGNPAVRTWWGDNHAFLLKKGVRGIWNDMNEPASFNGPLPDDIVFSEEDKYAPTWDADEEAADFAAVHPSCHAKIHNVYGHLMAKATYEGLKKLDGRRPFVITRACYAGSQKYALVWTGDNHSLWAHLQMAIPQLCNLGLSGFAFAGTDIGGFGSDTTPELLARWIQVGCFSPFCRNHSALGTRVQEPWRFGEEILRIYRKYVKLRYRLLPYLYDQFYACEQTGAPIMRPLLFDYETDQNVRNLNDEFLFGSRILVAPVVQPGVTCRMVYLPEGTWYDYWTGETHTGPTRLIREADLSTCPIYVKAGTVLPILPEQSYVGEKESDVLLLEVYPGEGSYDHYLDNGEDFAYRQGAYHHYHFTVKADGTVETAVLHAGYEKPYREITCRLLK